MPLLGLERALEQLRLYGEGFYDGVVAEQAAIAKDVMLLARDVYCPIRPPPVGGALRSTALVTAELRELHSASVDIQFGGPAAPYAAIVHEDPDAFHQPPTQWKYLERAVHELSPDMTPRIGESAVAAGKRRAGL